MVGPVHDEDAARLYSSRLSSSHIRLLETDPDNSSALSTRLKVVEISQSPQYVALSHFWGDDKDLVEMQVNGVGFNIPRNIRRLLESVRPHVTLTEYSDERSRLKSMRGVSFWVDAICINQGDKAELAEQVGIMRKIYASATATWVSTGQPLSIDLSGDRLIAWLHQMTEIPWQTFRKMLRDERLPLWEPEKWDLMAQVLEKPWFFRRWVIQEVVVASSVFILYGAALMPWDRFCDACLHCMLLYDDHDIIDPYNRRHDTQAANVEVVQSIQHLRIEERAGHRKPSLLELLVRFRRNGSMRSVDRVYALLGICDEGQARSFTIDYKASARDVLVEFVVSHVEHFNNLDFLNACLDAGRVVRRNVPYELDTGAPTWQSSGQSGGLRPGGLMINPDYQWPKAVMEDIVELPSWCPNWTSAYTDWRIGPRPYNAEAAYASIFKASGSMVPEIPELFAARSTGVLEVSGLDVDSVIELNRSWPPPHPDQRNPFSNFYAYTWFNVKKKPLEHTVYSDDQSRWDAFCRTLVVGGWIEDAGAFMSSRFLRHAFYQFFNDTAFNQLIRNMGFEFGIPPTEAEYFNDPPLPLRYEGIPSIALGMDSLTSFKFAVTEKGRLSLVQPFTRPGDRVCIIFGCSSPIILSPSTEQPGCWIVRGEAYVDGLMLGEAIIAYEAGLVEKTTFKLV